MNKPHFFYGWYIVIASWIMISLTGSVAVSLFFKPMLEDFGWDRAVLSSVQSIAMIIYAIMLPFLGRFIDRFGPKAMILVCVAAQVLSRVLNGVATMIWHLYLARLLYSINVLHGTQTLINRWFIKKRGTALGIAASGMSVGTLIFSPVTQYLIQMWDWRLTMLFWAAVALTIMSPLALLLKNNPADKGYGPDGEAIDRASQIGHPPHQVEDDWLAEFKVNGGSSFFEATRTRSFWFLSFVILICGIGCGFMMTHIVIFTTDMGYPDMAGASLVSVQGGLNLVGLLVTGLLSDKMVRKNVLALNHLIRGMSFMVIIIFIILGGGSLWLLYAAMVLFGFGWFTSAPLAAGLVADLFGNLRMGTILGVITAGHGFGMAIGAYAGGAIFELTQSYYIAFLTLGLLEIMAVILALSIKQKKHVE